MNGSLDGTHAPATGRIHWGTTDVFIGGVKDHEKKFRLLIDELCLYDRALAPDEIEAIYRAGTAGKVKPAQVEARDK